MLSAGTMALLATVDKHENTAELDTAFVDLKTQKKYTYGKRDYLKPQTRFGQQGHQFRGRPFTRNCLRK